MQRQHLEDPGSVTPDLHDPLMQVLARRGGEHELAFLSKLRAAGKDIREIGRDGGLDETRAALNSGAAVIYQAALEGHGFAV